MTDRNPFAWMDDAACRYEDPELFFSNVADDIRKALTICSGCRVREECLADALANRRYGRFGIRGGVTERNRAQLTRRRYAGDVALTP